MKRNRKVLAVLAVMSALLVPAACTSQNQTQTSSGSSTGASSEGSVAASSMNESSAKTGEESAASMTESQKEPSAESIQSSEQSSEPQQSTETSQELIENLSEKAIGNWTLSLAGTVINLNLKDDFTAVMTSNATAEKEGTWEVSGNQVILHINGVEEPLDYKDDTLCGVGEKASAVFVRGTTDLSEGSQPSDVSGVEEVSLDFDGHIDQQYVGTWKYGVIMSAFTEDEQSVLAEHQDEIDGVRFELRADGTAETNLGGSHTGVWESQDDKVNIIFDGSKVTFTWEDGKLTNAAVKGVVLVKE